MATSQGHPHTDSSSLDTLDIDQYINYDPSSLLSTPSDSPEISQSKSTPVPFEPVEYANTYQQTQPSRQTFAGPSHQYELHKQQTGLPVGALANTLAVNQGDHMLYGQAHRMFGIPPADAYYGMNTTDDLFDFNTAPSQTLGIDMDVDFAASIQDANSDYINPNAVGAEESSFSSMPPKQRAWPGMHQHHAAMAKAQAQQQRQQNASTSKSSSQRPTGNAAPAKDPIVEERISRLLNQMRHSSVASSTDDASTPTAHSSISHLGRAKKDEEDMDEDERLLASEEGKKLSSKERRQLRNKVSARAFRSRRKEYIGQLEGEIAAKTAEAGDLRAKNQALMSENTRLTDLTRMLLESPAFSTFLDEMSGTEKQFSTQSQQDAPAPKPEEPQQTAPKDINPHQASPQVQGEHSDASVGIALMPEPYINSNTGNTAWADNMDFGLYDAQVYAVTSMPEGPAIDRFDVNSLSCKPTSSLEALMSGNCKKDAPVIEYPPSPLQESRSQPHLAGKSNSQIDHSDPAFSLYDDAPQSSKPTYTEPQTVLQGSIRPEKADERLKLTVVDNTTGSNEVDAAVMEKFLRFCAVMEAPSRRVASVTSHLWR
ncbi:MAG: hypothetical protein Q9166_004772 [cf. Caloplaca sp. 2 TL-2023]